MSGMTTHIRGSRPVALLNGVAATALVAILAAIALVAHPPAPPGIAEFAPQATKPISKAPPGQSSSLGNGPGACTAVFVCANHPATPTAVPTAPGSGVAGTQHGVPSALQCYTWPDGSVTQTFDPQSPPCVASWPEADQGNGGVTSPGVTASEIRVALPVYDQAEAAQVRPWGDFFNAHFEFYGRKLVLVPFIASGGQTPQSAHADAAKASELNVFASVDEGLLYAMPAVPTYQQDLAAKKIVSATTGGGFTSEADYQRFAPYEWAYRPPLDSMERAAGTMACRQLVGRAASHSKEFATKTRSFAIMVPWGYGDRPTPSAIGFQQSLAGCGVHAKVYPMGHGDSSDTTTMAQLNADGITTVFIVNGGSCCANSAPNIMNGASQAGYFPEWIIPGGISDEDESYWALESAFGGEEAGLFGLAPWNRTLVPADTPASRAWNLAQKGFPPTYLLPVYDLFQILADGFQMAGPHLTPETFAHALETTIFPNPYAGVAPMYQARVGFALVWWNPGATSRAGSRTGGKGGAFCYVDNAHRWDPAGFPTADRFFDSGNAQC
jgi:hypothetical protein